MNELLYCELCNDELKSKQNVKRCIKCRSITHNLSSSRQYSIWLNMKSRCSNHKNPHFNSYGGKSISVCKEWLDFKIFYDWSLNNGYSENLTIDRINNSGNYNLAHH